MYFTTEPEGEPRLPFYTTVLCLVCVLILVVNGASLFHNLASLNGANAVQGKTVSVSDKLQKLNVLVMDAESNLRGYFLSGSDVYLGPMRTATAEVEPQFRELELLLADSPSQQKNLAQLRTLVWRKLDVLNQTIGVYREGGLADIARIAATDDSKADMDEIRLLMVIMAKEQNESMAAHRAAFYAEYQNAVILGIGINAAAILVILLFYRLIRSSFASRIVAQRALQHANENLESMVALRTDQLSVLSRHLIRLSEEEKSRLARELHDEMGANLTAISIDINGAADELRREHAHIAQRLDRARMTLITTVELKRRIVENLRPSLLDNLGLAAALQSYCEEFATVTGVDCEAMIEDGVDVAGPMHAIAVFRIVQEALNNVAKYAGARHVIVHLSRDGDGLALEVSDDGIGIDTDQAAKPKSHGLLGMRERALLLGGTLTVSRGVNDVGTSVEAWIPIEPKKNGAEAPGDASPGGAVPQLTMADASLSEPRPPAGGHTPSSPPCNTPRHIPPGLDGQLR
ncbi:CHASE3 domain-containing protein [Massilia cavernae]|uniref:Histidine kinase n=1 Tax=Massilia cavernae TaxID=2320864 RepID=A0A418XQG2_9BURK|nr:CHASE3 domain-containing protein [Massilia cavernae]RJG14665.1 histidine kinase [Massilia cavernae]